jgi:hypothetical protein
MLELALVHGYEKWYITEEDNVMLHMWQRKFLRKVYGLVTEQGA